MMNTMLCESITWTSTDNRYSINSFYKKWRKQHERRTHVYTTTYEIKLRRLLRINKFTTKKLILIKKTKQSPYPPATRCIAVSL